MLRHARWLLPVLLMAIGPPVRGAGDPPQVRVGLLQHAAQVSFTAPLGGTLSPASGGGAPVPLPAEDVWQALPTTDGIKVLRPDGSDIGTHR